MITTEAKTGCAESAAFADAVDTALDGNKVAFILKDDNGHTRIFYGDNMYDAARSRRDSMRFVEDGASRKAKVAELRASGADVDRIARALSVTVDTIHEDIVSILGSYAEFGYQTPVAVEGPTDDGVTLIRITHVRTADLEEINARHDGKATVDDYTAALRASRVIWPDETVRRKPTLPKALDPHISKDDLP